MLPINKMKSGIPFISLALMGMFSTQSFAQQAGFGSPDAVPNQLNQD
jgi:hypothetical protein